MQTATLNPVSSELNHSSAQALRICLAVNLPQINDDITEEIIKTFQNKKTVSELKKEIAQIKAALPVPIAQTDFYAAQVLLDKTTPAAAAYTLRILKGKAAITKFHSALGFNAKTQKLLVHYYASPASPFMFDEEMARALQQSGYRTHNTPDCARKAIQMLEDKAHSLKQDYCTKNKADIASFTIKYSLPMTNCFTFFNSYSIPGAREFAADFERTLTAVKEACADEKLASFLTSNVLAQKLTLQDAQNFAALSAAVPYTLTHDDIFTLGCRYLKKQNASEVASTLDALLKRLPFHEIKEENLKLALSVMTDACPQNLDLAMSKAQKNKDMAMFRKAISRYEYFDNFTYEIARKFTGTMQIKELLEKFEDIIAPLAHCSCASENNDLACKVLLNKITAQEAAAQAAYRRDLKAKSLTEGLAPEVLKKYLGTLDPQEIIERFESALAPYSFWKKDSAKHLYALEALVSQLNGTTNGEITRFVMQSLEEGKTVQTLCSVLAGLTPKEKIKITAAQLSERLPGAQDARQSAPQDAMSSIFDA